MHRRRLLSCLAAAALVGCGKTARQPRKLRVGLLPRYSLAPLYLADELGFFREAHLEVEMHPFSESLQLFPALAGGQLEATFGMVSPGFINAVLKGARPRIVAGRDIAVPGCTTGGAIFGHRKSFPGGLQDLRALKGKRVAVPGLVGISGFHLDQLLASAGMTRADIRPVVMRYPEAAAAVTAGKIDALAGTLMDMDLDRASGNVVRSITLAEVLPNYQYSFILFGPSLLGRDPETGVSFLWAYLRGVLAYRAGKNPRAMDELARAARTEPVAARAACREGISVDGRIDLPSVQRFVDWAFKNGYVPQAVEAARLIDSRFVEEAGRRLSRQRR